MLIANDGIFTADGSICHRFDMCRLVILQTYKVNVAVFHV